MGLLIYSIVLSIIIISSCHLIDAITPDDDAHSVGLISFENEMGNCVPHNTFVIDNYNGKEMTAKVGGYTAPSLGSLAVLFLVMELCRLDGCLGTKCIPGMLMVGATVCQGLTFLLFQSDVFCHNEAISSCELGKAGYNCIQAILMYAGCLVLYTFGPNPMPFSTSKANNTTSSKGSSSDKSSPKKTTTTTTKKKKSTKKKSGPGKGEDFTKEMYEQRRKEKKVKSRGVSGRSKEEIYHERLRKSSSRENEKYVNSIQLYDPENDPKRRSRSQQRYDDYVDTEPDGMDWSAFTPNQRDEYYERHRSKKRERRKEESEREKLRAWAREVDERRDRSRSPRIYGDDYSRGYDESYGDTYYDDEYQHEGKHRSYKGNYDVERIEDGDGDYTDDGSRSDMDSRYSRSQDNRDSRYSRNLDDSDTKYGRSQDDYSYAQDEYSYAEDYDDGAPGDDSYYSRSSYSSSRRSRSGGRSSRDRRSYNGPV